MRVWSPQRGLGLACSGRDDVTSMHARVSAQTPWPGGRGAGAWLTVVTWRNGKLSWVGERQFLE